MLTHKHRIAMGSSISENFSLLRQEEMNTLCKALIPLSRNSKEGAMLAGAISLLSYLHQSWEEGGSLIIQTKDKETYVVNGKP